VQNKGLQVVYDVDEKKYYSFYLSAGEEAVAFDLVLQK
jgi:hypothetical protein